MALFLDAPDDSEPRLISPPDLIEVPEVEGIEEEARLGFKG